MTLRYYLFRPAGVLRLSKEFISQRAALLRFASEKRQQIVQAVFDSDAKRVGCLGYYLDFDDAGFRCDQDKRSFEASINLAFSHPGSARYPEYQRVVADYRWNVSDRQCDRILADFLPDAPVTGRIPFASSFRRAA